jgi:hypothetical protein
MLRRVRDLCSFIRETPSRQRRRMGKEQATNPAVRTLIKVSGASEMSSESVRNQLLRTRELARRARRLAEGLTLEADRNRLLRHAEELETQAADLERTFEPVAPVPQVPEAQVQVQQQQQQQQAEAPQAEQTEDKPKS